MSDQDPRIDEAENQRDHPDTFGDEPAGWDAMWERIARGEPPC